MPKVTCLPVSAINMQSLLPMYLLAYTSAFAYYSMGISSCVTPVEQLQRQLAHRCLL